MDIINSKKIDYDGCIQKNDSLISIIKDCKSSFRLMSSNDSILKRQIVIKDSMIGDRNSVIDTMKLVLKHREKQIKALKRKKALSEVITGVLGAVIIYILVF